MSTSTVYDVAPWVPSQVSSGGSFGCASSVPSTGETGVGGATGLIVKLALDQLDSAPLALMARTRQFWSPVRAGPWAPSGCWWW